jgi:hypothetical protein
VQKPKFDLQSENFDLYFAKEISKMNEHQKGQIPRELLFKLFVRTGVLNYRTSKRIGFLGKLYLLSAGLGKRVYIVVENDEGTSVEEFAKLKRDVKTRRIESDHAKAMTSLGTYVAGGKDLIDTLSYMSDVCSHPLYNYLNKLRNVPKNKAEVWKEETSFVMKFLTRYEGNKKRWMAETGLNIQEFMILIALYGGEEVKSIDIIRETYKGSLYSGSTRMKTAFSTLQNKLLIVKYGNTRDAKMKITPRGSDMIRNILFRYAIN